jgi:hypothetical protein
LGSKVFIGFAPKVLTFCFPGQHFSLSAVPRLPISQTARLSRLSSLSQGLRSYAVILRIATPRMRPVMPYRWGPSFMVKTASTCRGRPITCSKPAMSGSPGHCVPLVVPSLRLLQSMWTVSCPGRVHSGLRFNQKPLQRDTVPLSKKDHRFDPPFPCFFPASKKNR